MSKKDVNQLAKYVTEVATGDVPKPNKYTGKNPAAVELGRLGGLKGGNARAKILTPAQRKEIATKAAKKRWEK